MGDKLVQLQRKMDKLSLRERAMIVLCTVGSIIYLSFFYYFEPNLKLLDRNAKSLVAEKTRIETLGMQLDQVQSLQIKKTVDPNVARKTLLSREVRQLEGKLDSLVSSFISATEMAKFLQRILEETEGVKLVSISNNPAEVVQDVDNKVVVKEGEKSSGRAEQSTDVFYKHGIQMEISGKYFDIVTYLEKIEALPWSLYWDSIEYQVLEYPESRLKINVYSLSREESLVRG